MNTLARCALVSCGLWASVLSACNERQSASDAARLGQSQSALSLVFKEQQQLLASDGTPHDYFGNAVGLSGTVAVVGAYYKGGGTGGAYVFARSGSSWSEQQKL